ncbi:MAG: putative lipid II flippase FtsW [Patescibacteria group bacterium]|nr:putative lipid II flippase FtsW [Patescibacteria group bacterium]
MKKKKPDTILFLLTIFLTLFGVIMVYNASVFESYQLFLDKYHFLKLQALWVTLGFLGLLVTTHISLDFIKKISPIALLINIILLIIVLIPGLSDKSFGARRWISIAGFNLQPTELIKLILSIYLAAWLAKKRNFLPFLAILGLILGLIMLQPDLGTSIVIVLIGVIVYYVSGAKLIHLILTGLIGAFSGIGLILLSPYRKARILTFFDPSKDSLGSSYHITQALIAIGSGGFWGLGLGQSRQKYQFLPQVTTDSIFAIISEEIGFFGTSLLILALFAFVLRGFKIAGRAKNDFSKLLAVGISGWIGVQIIINLGAMLALLPLTGVPLPFISYGGSSMIVMLIGVGLLLNISRDQISPKKR